MKTHKEVLKEIEGKDFLSLDVASDYKKWNTTKLIRHIVEREYIQTRDGKYIDARFLKIVEDGEVEKEDKSNKQVEDIKASEILKKIADNLTLDDVEISSINLANKETNWKPKRRVGSPDIKTIEDDFTQLENDQLIWGSKGELDDGGLYQALKQDQVKYNVEMSNSLTQAEEERLKELKEQEEFKKILKEDDIETKSKMSEYKRIYGTGDNYGLDPWEY